MMLGHVRDQFPRLSLSLPSITGSLTVEFIVDTGFDGELALPGALLRALDAAYIGTIPSCWQMEPSAPGPFIRHG